MGRPHVYSMYARYPMRDLIALGPNVCAHRQNTSPERLNFNYASTESLFNAVKKQYGNSHLLKLTLPSPPPSGVPSPALPPRLPNNPETSGPDAPPPPTKAESFTIKMIEADLESTAKFVRELAVESLIPWMGKCILEWNEAVSVPFAPPNLRAHQTYVLDVGCQYSSSRRLPSRLFSSTRRLFGTGSVSNSPAQSSVSLPAHGHTGSTSSVASLSGNVTPLAQQRRLAEFATILGDYKLAIPIWEVVRREGKGGSVSTNPFYRSART